MTGPEFGLIGGSQLIWSLFSLNVVVLVMVNLKIAVSFSRKFNSLIYFYSLLISIHSLENLFKFHCNQLPSSLEYTILYFCSQMTQEVKCRVKSKLKVI